MSFIFNFLIIITFIFAFFVYIGTDENRKDQFKSSIKYETFSDDKKLRTDGYIKKMNDVSFYIMIIDFALLLAKIITY